MKLDSLKMVLRFVYWIYVAGYLAFVVIAGLRAWPGTTWGAWWTELMLQAGWYGALWPYYLPNLLGVW